MLRCSVGTNLSFFFYSSDRDAAAVRSVGGTYPFMGIVRRCLRLSVGNKELHGYSLPYNCPPGSKEPSWRLRETRR